MIPLQKMKDLNEEQKRYMTWLYNTMPPGDAVDYDFDLFLSFVDHALMIRKKLPWCRELDEEKFRNDVLYYRVNNEDISNCRPVFYHHLIDRIKNLKSEARILEVNRWCHEMATYQSDDDRTVSPLTVYRSGYGRCGEESNFLVSALRSVGIAARQIYVPWWSHCDDNHAWVEAWSDNAWYFLGACEPEPILNSGWFNNASSRAMLVVSRAFAYDPQEGMLLGKFGPVYLYNQTSRYALIRHYEFKVLNCGQPVEGASVRFEVLNMGEFCPIITLITDHEGKVTIDMGRGDIHLSVSFKNRTADCICHGKNQGKMDIELHEWEEGGSEWIPFNFVAPEDSPVNTVTYNIEQKKRRREELERGTALREQRIKDFYDQKKASEFPEATSYFRQAAGNFIEVYRFLKRDRNPMRMKMLSVLSQKDFIDVNADILEDHLSGSMAFARSFPKDIFERYILCPRISLETLEPWRSKIGQMVTDQEKRIWCLSPYRLWQDLGRTIRCFDNGGYFHFAISPIAAFKEKIADKVGLCILFIAVCRTLGIPARLNPEDQMPEYWNDNKFYSVNKQEEESSVVFTREAKDRFVYHQNWGLSRWMSDHWQGIDLSEKSWDAQTQNILLSEGYYRIITTNRLPNGNQFAMEKRFHTNNEETIKINLMLRPYQVSDMLESFVLPSFDFFQQDGAEWSSNDIFNGSGYKLLIWLEEGMEPTEHVLNELSASRSYLSGLPVSINFFLRSCQSLKQKTLADLLFRWDKIHPFYGNWSDNLNLVARRVYGDPGRPPLIALCNKAGQAIYTCSGYNVGIVDTIVKIIKYTMTNK